MKALIESYETNRAMRETYIRMNGFTHVEAWDHDDGDGYMPALCSGDGIGIPEHALRFYTIGQVEAWAKRYAPELPFVN